MKGAIIIQDKGSGRASAVQILGVPDIETLVSIANGLRVFTCGKIVAVSYTETQAYTADDFIDGKHDSVVSHKAIMNMIDMDAESGESPSMVLRWPAPVDTMLQLTKDGYIVDSLLGDSFAAVIGGRLGKTIEFRNGYVKR